MKKIILKCIVFVSILFIMLFALSRVFEPKDTSEEAGMYNLYANGILAEPEDTLDVLFLGDSEAYTSFIPLEAWNQYGFTSYLCGTPSQRLPLTVKYLIKATEKQNPKILMLEVDNFYKASSVARISEAVLYDILPIIEYHDRWKELTVDDFTKSPEYTTINPNQGYYYSTKIKSASDDEEYMPSTGKERKIRKSNRPYIYYIKDYCDKNNIELIFYSTPAIKNWTKEKHDGVEKFAKELGVEYLDLNLKAQEIGINWKKDSRDRGDHLNYTGSLKTTAYLAEWLSKKNLPDHRGEEKYSYWNELYANYDKEIKQDPEVVQMVNDSLNEKNNKQDAKNKDKNKDNKDAVLNKTSSTSKNENEGKKENK